MRFGRAGFVEEGMDLTAKNIMSKNVVCVPRRMDLRDLAKLFLEKGFTGAPVVDEQGNLAGVISQTDLLYYQLTRDDELKLDNDFYASVKVEGRHLPSGYQIEDLNTGRVEDIMTPVVHSVREGADLVAVARMMTRKHIHRVIVRRGRKAVGIISALDLLRVLAQNGGAVAGGEKAPTRRVTRRTVIKKKVRRTA
jgi:CBS domain-containing protein